MRWGSRRVGVLATSVAVACLAVAASSVGTTYAAFSDFVEQNGHHVGAAKVELGVLGHDGTPRLNYPGLLPDEPKSDSFVVAYRGTIPADLALEIRPDGGSPYCDSLDDGSWVAKPGGQVQIDLGSGWVDYCSLLGPTVSVPVRSGVAPGTDLTVSVSVRLAPGTDYRYSQLTDTDRLTITARQASATTGGFTDFAVGTIAIGTGTILPTIPERCGTAADYPGGIVYGTEGPDHIEGGNQGQIIFGLGGDDVLIGGNAKDCLVGGPGNDQLWGNNGKDSIDGGDGDDILIGGNGADDLVGGDGNDVCYGGNGPDDIQCEAAPTSDGPAPPPAPTTLTTSTSTSTSTDESTTPSTTTSTTDESSPVVPPTDPETSIPPVEEEQPSTEEVTGTTS